MLKSILATLKTPAAQKALRIAFRAVKGLLLIKETSDTVKATKPKADDERN